MKDKSICCVISSSNGIHGSILLVDASIRYTINDPIWNIKVITICNTKKVRFFRAILIGYLHRRHSMFSEEKKKTKTMRIKYNVRTKPMPVVVSTDNSSRAQSVALVIKLHLKSLRQHRKLKPRHTRTSKRLAKNVSMDDNKKHHHFRSNKHSSSETLPAAVLCTTIEDFLKMKQH